LPISGALSTYAARKLDVSRKDSDTLGVECAQVAILEKANQIRLSCFLNGLECAGLEVKVLIAQRHFFRNVAHEALELPSSSNVFSAFQCFIGNFGVHVKVLLQCV
jgi:hypothetical protein